MIDKQHRPEDIHSFKTNTLGSFANTLRSSADTLRSSANTLGSSANTLGSSANTFTESVAITLLKAPANLFKITYVPQVDCWERFVLIYIVAFLFGY